jgi:hypothetical protein
MQEKLEQSTNRMIFRVRLLGIFSILLGVGYGVLFLNGLTELIVEPIVLIVASFILVGAFAVYLPMQLVKRLDQEVSVGRYFFGCGIGLSTAFFLSAIAFLTLGIDSFSDFLIVYRWETLLLIPYIISSFIGASLCFNIGYRYHRITELVDPKKGSIFLQGGLFIAVGIPSLGMSVFLFILSAFFWDPIFEILTVLAFILLVLFFIIFIVSACMDQKLSSQKND